MTRTSLILITVILSGFAVGAATDNPVVGKWDLTATDSEGNVSSWVLAVEEKEGTLSGSLTGTEGTFELVDPRLDGRTFTFKVMVNGQTYLAETRINGKRLEGKYKGPDVSGTLKADKQS